ncbi:MAG: GIY-YIG nuclease family protein [Mariprofundaceae bacterium]|nr:GIY-YIG nuclease family protein [Mariprofundaceae bacterium]
MAMMKASAHDSTPADSETTWFLYLIRCKDGALYTGITTDVDRRFAEHQSGKGAKYLRGKASLTLAFQQKIGSRSAALKAEASIKKLSKADKETIINTGRAMK